LAISRLIQIIAAPDAQHHQQYRQHNAERQQRQQQQADADRAPPRRF